jgi:hypothetical protein
MGKPAHVGLVARQTVESFRYHDIKLLFAGSVDQGLIARTEASSPADSRIVKGLHQRPVVAADELPAKSNLVVYRRLALAVGGVSRVDGCSLDHAASQSPSAKSGGSIWPPSRLSASLNICRAACRARCLTRTDSGACFPSWCRAPGRGASQRSGSGVVAGMWVPVVIDLGHTPELRPIRFDPQVMAPPADHPAKFTMCGFCSTSVMVLRGGIVLPCERGDD